MSSRWLKVLLFATGTAVTMLLANIVTGAATALLPEQLTRNRWLVASLLIAVLIMLIALDVIARRPDNGDTSHHQQVANETSGRPFMSHLVVFVIFAGLLVAGVNYINAQVEDFLAQPEIAVTPTSGTWNTRITINGKKFNTNSTVKISFGYEDVAIVRTESDGSFRATFDVPPSYQRLQRSPAYWSNQTVTIVVDGGLRYYTTVEFLLIAD